MEFRKYQHVERFGNDEVEGIEFGELFIFPKLDGSNGSIWLDNEEIKAGSRNRVLALDNDNAGFLQYVLDNKKFKEYLLKHPNHRLYGEWLVPHSFKNYRDDAWKRFYIFDIVVEYDEENYEYLTYDIYKPLLEEFDLDFILPICKMKNGSYDAFLKAIEKNTFMVKDDAGVGEGIVIKNYDYKNKYGRITWAKMVTNEFKEKNIKAMGTTEIEAKKMVEEEIVNAYCTEAFIEKEYNKIVNDKEGWTSRYIPELLGRIYSELIKEESWNFVKEFKNPTINYKTLNAFVVNKVKRIKPELF
jgi:hypothetical protein